MSTLRVLRLTAAAATLAARAQAQQRDTVPLAPVVVTATREPASAATLASSVSVLEGADLARAGITTVGDAIRSLPGAQVVTSGSFGAVTSLFVRGGQSTYVRVLVDGVPVEATGGYLDLANVATLNVERIELVRGPGSVVYGSDAISGVMQIFTKRPEGRRTDLAVSGGTYGSTDASASLSTGARRAGATLALAQQATDGIYAFNNRYRNTTASGSLHLVPDARSDVLLTARYTDALFHYPTDGNGTPGDSNQFQTGRVTTVSLAASRFFTARLEGQLLLGYNQTRDRTDNEPDNAGDTTGLYLFHSLGDLTRRSADARVNLHVGSGSVVTVGGALESESERDTNDYHFGSFAGGGSLDTSRLNRALYGQLVTSWAERLWLQAGVRADDNDKFGTFGTWRLGATARAVGTTRLKASVGRAFQEPSFAQTYSSGFTVGNPDLKPEHTLSWEVGVEQSIAAPAGLLSLTYFSQQFRDMIEYDGSGPFGSPNFFNLAGVNASGVEVAARVMPSEAFRLGAQYTFLHTVVTDPGNDSATFAPGRPLIRRPEHSASLTLDVLPRGPVGGGLRLLLVGRREDLDFTTFPASRVVLPAYSRIDLWGDIALLGRSPGTTVSLTARLDNALNASYQEVYRFLTPGRLLRLGLRVASGH